MVHRFPWNIPTPHHEAPVSVHHQQKVLWHTVDRWDPALPSNAWGIWVAVAPSEPCRGLGLHINVQHLLGSYQLHGFLETVA